MTELGISCSHMVFKVNVAAVCFSCKQTTAYVFQKKYQLAFFKTVLIEQDLQIILIYTTKL